MATEEEKWASWFCYCMRRGAGGFSFYGTEAMSKAIAGARRHWQKHHQGMTDDPPDTAEFRRDEGPTVLSGGQKIPWWEPTDE